MQRAISDRCRRPRRSHGPREPATGNAGRIDPGTHGQVTVVVGSDRHLLDQQRRQRTATECQHVHLEAHAFCGEDEAASQFAARKVVSLVLKASERIIRGEPRLPNTQVASQRIGRRLRCVNLRLWIPAAVAAEYRSAAPQWHVADAKADQAIGQIGR